MRIWMLLFCTLNYHCLTAVDKEQLHNQYLENHRIIINYITHNCYMSALDTQKQQTSSSKKNDIDYDLIRSIIIYNIAHKCYNVPAPDTQEQKESLIKRFKIDAELIRKKSLKEIGIHLVLLSVLYKQIKDLMDVPLFAPFTKRERNFMHFVTVGVGITLKETLQWGLCCYNHVKNQEKVKRIVEVLEKDEKSFRPESINRKST